MILFRSYFSARKTEILQYLFIALSWILGLLSSFLVFRKHIITLMCPLIIDRVSIVGMIVALIFPIFLLYILLSRCNIYFILPVIYFKAFLYMCCCLSITLAFGDAGWLVRILMLFSDSVSVLLLLFLSFSFIKGKSGVLERYFGFSVLLLFVVGCMDYYFISPFTMMLLKY